LVRCFKEYIGEKWKNHWSLGSNPMKILNCWWQFNILLNFFFKYFSLNKNPTRPKRQPPQFFGCHGNFFLFSCESFYVFFFWSMVLSSQKKSSKKVNLIHQQVQNYRPNHYISYHRKISPWNFSHPISHCGIRMDRNKFIKKNLKL
jgi:hypothetical protein